MKNRIFIWLWVLGFLGAIIAGCDEGTLKKPLSSASDRPAFIAELDGRAVEVVKEALQDQNPLVRTNAIEVVSTSNKIDLMPTVVKLLKDEYAPVRFAAVLAVGELKYYSGLNRVKELLKDPDDNVRIAAAYALSGLGQKGYNDLLYGAIKSKNITVRANAALLLGRAGDEDALKYLYWVLRDSQSDDKVRFQAVEAIAMLGDEKIYEKIWIMLISAYADDKVMGIKAMGALKTVKARDAIVTMLDDELEEVRLAAAEQLGALGDAGGEREVLAFLSRPPVEEDKLTAERKNVLAAMAIGQIGTGSLTKYLPQLLQNDSKAVRLAAAKAVFMLTR